MKRVIWTLAIFIFYFPDSTFESDASAFAPYGLTQQLNQAQSKRQIGIRPQLIEDVVLTKDERERLRSIQVICPNSDTGTLTVTQKNVEGLVSIYRLYFRNGVPAGIALFAAEKGEAFQPLVQIKITKNPNKDEISLGLAMSEFGVKLFKNICNGSKAARKKFRANLEADQRILGISAEEYPSNF